MSYQKERDEFTARMAREGLPTDTIRAVLRAATALQRYAELSCSSEAADRDRVPCPATRAKKPGPCLCDMYQDVHQDIPRIDLQAYQVETRAVSAMPEGWQIVTQGDPRGYVLRIVPPSYADRNKGRDRFNLDTIGVPSAPSRLRF